jgi:hypothetical protein
VKGKLISFFSKKERKGGRKVGKSRQGVRGEGYLMGRQTDKKEENLKEE